MMVPGSGRRRRLMWLCGLCCLLWAGAAWSSELPGQFSNELNTDHYDCLLTLQPAKNLSVDRTVTLTLETSHGASRDVRCVITRANIRVFADIKGKRQQIGMLPSQVVPGTAYELTLIRRGASLAIFYDHTFLFRGMANKGVGTIATISADAGWSVMNARIQRLEPVAFTDDFMRTADDQKTALGAWTAVSGLWALQSTWDNVPQGIGNKFASTIFAENPFAWIGHSADGTPAICTTGPSDWEDYTYSVAINPDAHGAVGVLVNVADERHGLLVRWSPANDHSKGGNALELFRLDNYQRILLASSPGGYVPGQWYCLTVNSSLEGLRVSIDERERIHQDTVDPWRGGVGLYSEGKEGSVFDDITVYGHSLDTDLLREIRQSRITKRFIDDDKGMKEWAVNPDLWQPDSNVPGLYWYPDTLYGEHNWEYLTINPLGHASGEVELILHGSARAPLKTGYRAVIALAGTPPRQTYTIFRGTTQLARKMVKPLTPDTDYSVRLTHIGTQISLLLDDTAVLQVTDAIPLSGGQAGYHLTGSAFCRTNEIHAQSRNMLDYTFSEEPADWFSVGTWMPSVRWACTPTWSFLGGWSRGDAVLWHKESFAGDQSLEAFMGEMMEYPREREDYFSLRYQGYFAVTICGDGKDPRNGYCAIFGAPDADGTPHQRVVLLRNGIEVASSPITRHGWWENHREWFGLRLEKQGNVISFRIKRGWDKYELSYPDTNPLAGGIPAIWTHNNAISLARVRLNCANTPTPCNEPRVVIDSPWYPEWANVGKTATLHFPESWSTNGKPVVLRAIPQDVPTGDQIAAAVAQTDVNVTPTTIGAHWYQVVASDGMNTSPPFQLDQDVFNPALGRDDSHTLLLYRFDEGSGQTVHDHSTLAPALNLTLPDALNNARWLPGQGLALHGPNPLTSVGAADKLLALGKTKGCTIEFWISTETIFSPYTLFAWSQGANTRNLTIDHYRNNLHVNTPLFAEGNVDGDGTFYRMRTSLQHYVFTWDGNTTRCYCNGIFAGQMAASWGTSLWQSSYPITLGKAYLGTFYLFALHDRCFTPEEVIRHYQAGPSAR